MEKAKNSDDKRGQANRLLLTSCVVLIWAGSFYLVRLALSEPMVALPKSDGLATLLFGAASVALFLLSIFLALVALISWNTLLRTMRKTAVDAARATTSRLQDELRGRVLSIMGYLVGEMSTNPDTLELENRDRLAEAIDLCQKGYNLLKKVEGSSKYMALNNLVFYSCVYNDEAKHRFLLEQATDLRRAGQEHEAPKLLLTACRVILQLGSDEKERKEACQILRALVGKSQISSGERKEALLYLKQFCNSSDVH